MYISFWGHGDRGEEPWDEGAGALGAGVGVKGVGVKSGGEEESGAEGTNSVSVLSTTP